MPDCSKPPLELDFPPRNLHPNARPHRMAKHKSAQKYKNDCFILTKQWLRKERPEIPSTEKIGLYLLFIPPSTPGPVGDDDGMEAAFKYGRDGLALALGIDDRRFSAKRAVLPRDPKYRHGVVFVELTPID